MLFELQVRLAHHGIRIDAGLEHERRVDALLSAGRDADDGRVADAGHVIQDALDILRKDVQPFRRHDHFLLAPANEELAARSDLADVAGVEPAVLERPRGFGRRR